MTDAVLQIEGIQKSFGGLRAVNQVSFEVATGELLGLIGPNGAGKTTIFNMISGIYRTDGGRIVFDGVNITNRNPTQIAKLGVARTFQVPRTFNHMTVEENLKVPNIRLRLPDAEISERTETMLQEIGLHEMRHRNASELSGGERQLLQFARAVLTQPKLMILDEPFAGSSPGIIDVMIEKTLAIAKSGVACLVISHDILSLPRVCERAIVLTEGSVLTQGTLGQVREDTRVIEAYLGA
jgi:branched-chain amino acid transport system ATP-binding protein